MPVFNNNILAGASGQTSGAAAAEYVIPKSLRFNSGDSAYLSRTPASAGNRKTWTWSGWIKKCGQGSYQKFFFGGNTSDEHGFRFEDTDQLSVYRYSGSFTFQVKTTRVFRDPAAFFHLVVAYDSTQATASNRVKIYINGVQETDFATSTYPSQYSDYGINNTVEQSIGRLSGAPSSEYFNGYLADIQFVDGQQLAPTDFGETRSSDGVWVPKEFAGTFSSDPVTIQVGTPSYPSDFTSTGNKTSDQTGLSFGSWSGTYTGANTKIFKASDDSVFSILVDTTGRNDDRLLWYSDNLTDWTYIGNGNAFSPPYTLSGHKYYCTSEGAGDVTLHVSNPTFNSFHLNFSDSSTIEALGYDSAATVPDLDPKKGMDVVTYTGNGGTQNIGGLGFEPDLIWCKTRSNAVDHKLVDSVRGVTNVLEPNQTRADSTGITNGITAINPDGFALGNSGDFNTSGRTYVAWTWRAGGPAVANTNGSITSQVSANNDYGFSIVSYSGTGSNATVGHGLSSAPKWIIVKDRSQATGWAVYHDAIGTSTNNYIELQSSGTSAQDDTAFQDTAPTNSVFSIGTKAAVNESGDDFIAYCWSEVSGFSKISSYTGTGGALSVTGLGFKPRFLLIRATGTGSWMLFDSKRGTDVRLKAQTSDADASASISLTFDSDGFSLNTSDSDFNGNGNNYIYAAFADRPGNNWDVNNIVTNEGLTTSKDNFDVVTYTGTSSTQSIDSLAFQPDLVWVKNKDQSEKHVFTDSVRGIGNALYTSSDSAEDSGSTYSDRFVSLDSDGFTVGSSHTTTNSSGDDFVAYCWKAGGTAVSNTDGSITSSVSANAEYGFSIVTYTGAGSTQTIGHGLGKVPKMILVKKRNSTENWGVYHVGIGNGNRLALNSTGSSTSTTTWNNTTPTSSVFSVGAASLSNSDGDTYVAYCFADIPGYQRFGSVDTGSDPIVITGFKPRFLLTKKTSGSEHWFLHDSERDPDDDDNTTTFEVNNNGASESGANRKVKFLDNGFQLVGADVDVSSATSIYWAIGDDEIGSDEDCLVDVPNAVTADADATDTTGGYQRGNYCTWNSVAPVSNGSSYSTFSNGNLEGTTSNSNVSGALGTIGVSSGKWYYEITCGAFTGGTGLEIGASQEDLANTISASEGPGDCPNGYFYINDGRKVNNSSPSSYGASYTNGDVIGVALDLDNSTIEFFKNGVSQGDAYTNMNDGTYFPAVGDYNNSGTASFAANFGQMRFKYPMPSGYAALNTTALPDATIADGSTAFETKLWTGNGSSQNIATNFSPDFAWIKKRGGSGIARGHCLQDIVRGAGKTLESHTTAAEFDDTNAVTAFNSDGLSIGSEDRVNENNGTYVGWIWDAGSSTVSNTDGSITSSVRASQTTGFSIVTWTGNAGNATIGHGLNAAPELILLKFRGSTSNWSVYHSGIGNTKRLVLNSTGASGASSTYWQNTSPTSSVFSVGGDVNDSTTIVAYCISPVAGYSAVGSYTGNGSSDGPFVALSFRPSWVMIKRDGEGDWRIWDTSRDPINVADNKLYPNKSNAETGSSDTNEIDILSNGFKLRSSVSEGNASGDTYIYVAFAENPFQANGGLAR